MWARQTISTGHHRCLVVVWCRTRPRVVVVVVGGGGGGSGGGGGGGRLTTLMMMRCSVDGWRCEWYLFGYLRAARGDD